MKPVCLSITNFRSFTKTAVFRFPDGPGLFFLWGENQEEPRLEANGSGKSSLWEALTWLMFGKTSRGIKAGDVANWDAGKSTVVELVCLGACGEAFTMRRTWGPISWTLTSPSGDVEDLTKDDSNALVGLLRLSFSGWLNVVLMAQGQPMFLDLKPDAKATLFSDVMGLDHWLQYSKRAGETASSWDAQQHEHERALSKVIGQLEQLALSDDTINTGGLDWERSHADKREALRVRYAEALEQLKAWTWTLHDAEAAESLARCNLAECHSAKEHTNAAVLKAQVTFTDCRRDVDRDTHLVNDALRRLEQAKTAICPTCHEPISAHALVRNVGNAKATADAAMDQQDDNAQKFDALDLALQRAIKADDDSIDTHLRATNAVRDAAGVTNRVRRDRELISRDLDDMEAEDDKLAEEVSPWATILEHRRLALQQLGDEQHRLHREIDFCDSQRILAAQWIKWFKEIRLASIAEALTQLEIEVNAQAMVLGLVDWELRFDVDRETKSGNIQRGFLTTVISPHNKDPVPWEAWSGGEGQRLRIAAQMGLADLMRKKLGVTFPLEIWDEPTQWLSGQGVQDLLDGLQERSKREGLQVWVVDHRSLGYGGFDGSAGVIKNAAGSHVEMGPYICSAQ